jgi:beta-N-acetylhexosaminidase
VSGELRRRLGFDGVTITDSLDAAAALAFGSRARVALAAAQAGNDLLLYGDWRAARRAGAALRRKLASGKLDRESFEDSVERVLELRRDLAD